MGEETIELEDLGRTSLHKLCAGSDESDLLNEVKDDLKRNQHVNGYINKTEEKYNATALHFAIQRGHCEVALYLIDQNAAFNINLMYAVEKPKKKGDTAVHIACRKGFVSLIQRMYKRTPKCIYQEGFDDATPLMTACLHGQTNIVNFLLSDEVKHTNLTVAQFVNTVTDNTTAIIAAVVFKNAPLDIVRKLAQAGANLDFKCGEESAVTMASYHGHAQVVKELLDRHATFDRKTMRYAVTTGNEDVVMEILKTDYWLRGMCQSFSTTDSKTTPFRELIRIMPDAATEVLNKCVIIQKKQGIEQYQVTYHYTFLEDFTNNVVMRNHSDVFGTTMLDHYYDEVNKDRQIKDITELESEDLSQWKFGKFTKLKQHPLQIMVHSGCLGLLDHPVVRSLIHQKWKTFGCASYFLILLLQLLLVGFFTPLLFQLPSALCDFDVRMNSQLTYDFDQESCGHNKGAVYGLSTLVIIITVLLLIVAFLLVSVHLKEVCYDSTNLLNILIDTTFLLNLMNIFVSLSCLSLSIIWITRTTKELFSTVAQLQFAFFVLYLSWFQFILICDKLPVIGLYVVMFRKVLFTFVKVSFFGILLVFTFAVVFMALFRDPHVQRSPFVNFPQSIIKTMTMTAGDVGYDSIFRLDPSGVRDEDEEILFPLLSRLIWIFFLIIMPILFANMLIGLAVENTQETLKQSRLKVLALQVEHTLIIELMLLHFGILQSCKSKLGTKPTLTFKLASETTRLTLLRRLSLFLWGGERYDTYKNLKPFIKQKI